MALMETPAGIFVTKSVLLWCVLVIPRPEKKKKKKKKKEDRNQ